MPFKNYNYTVLLQLYLLFWLLETVVFLTLSCFTAIATLTKSLLHNQNQYLQQTCSYKCFAATTIIQSCFHNYKSCFHIITASSKGFISVSPNQGNCISIQIDHWARSYQPSSSQHTWLSFSLHIPLSSATSITILLNLVRDLFRHVSCWNCSFFICYNILNVILFGCCRLHFIL